MFRVDDNFPDSQKVELLGERYPKLFSKCISLWLFCGCYSARTGTNGALSETRIRNISPFLGITKRHIEALCDVGLWDKVDGEKPVYWFHDYSDWNETKQQKAERLRKDRERQRNHRNKNKKSPVTRDVTGDTHKNATSDSRDPTITIPITNTNLTPIPLLENSEKVVWLKVIKLHAETTGHTVEPGNHQKAAESILRQATQLDPDKPLVVVERAFKAWWADDWAKEHPLALGHLAKYFSQYANGSPQLDQDKLTDLKRLIRETKQDIKLYRNMGDESTAAKAEARYQKLKTQKQQLEGAA